jgi:triosephosphate isomerase
MRKKLVAGNWKMNLLWDDAISLITDVINLEKSANLTHTEVAIYPPSIYLRHGIELVKNTGSALKIGAQNCSEQINGAFTGELSAAMLSSLGTSAVIIGHSERRAYYAETNELLNAKVKAVLASNLKAIYCCGETLNERENKVHFDVIETQIKVGLAGLTADDLENLVIAYEPVWAIGTGKTASPDQAQEIHAFIRNSISSTFSQHVADKIQILYGGSVKPDNAPVLFAQPDVDGGLIGGAALKVDSFKAIIMAAEQAS